MCWRDRTGFGLQGPQGQCLGQLGEVGTLQPLVQGPVGPLSWHSRAVKTKQTRLSYVKNYTQIQTFPQLHCSVYNCLELGLGLE